MKLQFFRYLFYCFKLKAFRFSVSLNYQLRISKNFLTNIFLLVDSVYRGVVLILISIFILAVGITRYTNLTNGL